MKNTIKVLWYIIISTMVLTMFVLVSMSWGHSEGSDPLVGSGGEVASGYDYGEDHRMYQYYDTHHDHGYGWHWHRNGSGNSYEDKHKSNLGTCNHADAWVVACIGAGDPDPPVEEDPYTGYHAHDVVDENEIIGTLLYGAEIVHRHLKTDHDSDGNHPVETPELSDEVDEPFVSHRNDVIHAHNYTDLDPDDPANVDVYDWHEHKGARQSDGSTVYTEISHHGIAQHDSGHDGYVDNPEPSDFDFEPGILPEMEVVTPEYPVQPDVDTVRPTAPTKIMETLDEVKDRLPDPDEQPAPPDDISMIDNPVEAIVEAAPIELVRHEWTWLKGYNLVSFPVMKEGIETVSDLYQAFYTIFNPPQDIIYVAIDGCWYGYNGQEGQIAGDVQITPYLGVLMLMDWSATIAMSGVEQIGDGEVELKLGLNVVGLSELPSRYRVPSDFLEVDGIEMVMTTAWDDEEYMNNLRLVGRAGDPGDTPLYLGQAVILITSVLLTLDMSEPVAAAPSVRRKGTLATSWGAMKR